MGALDLIESSGLDLLDSKAKHQKYIVEGSKEETDVTTLNGLFFSGDRNRCKVHERLFFQIRKCREAKGEEKIKHDKSFRKLGLERKRKLVQRRGRRFGMSFFKGDPKLLEFVGVLSFKNNIRRPISWFDFD